MVDADRGPARQADDLEDVDDPHLAVLLGIAAELTTIRRELQTTNDSPPPAEEGPIYECALCEEAITGDRDAKTHAVTEHGAPRSDWRTAYTDNQHD